MEKYLVPSNKQYNNNKSKEKNEDISTSDIGYMAQHNLFDQLPDLQVNF